MTPSATDAPQPTSRSTLASTALLLVRLAAAAAFGFSAWQKLQPGIPPVTGPQTFALSVKSYQILPEALISPAAFTIAWVEAICALLILTGLWTRAAAMTLALAVVAFTLGVISVILRGIDITCGCFGKFKFICSGPVSWCKVGENSIFLAGLVVLVVFGAGKWALDAKNSVPAPKPV
jgi:uncharacterized membrane protein YphA (DoxX/SURF4 family)